MADTFRETAQELAPRGLFLRDRVSQAYLEALGGAVADTTALVRDGVLARWARTAPDDALALIGDTRQIEQAPGETKTAYRARLADAWDIHSDRGTKDAYRNVLEPLGVDPANVVVWDNWEDDGIPPPPGDDPWWSRVWIVVDSSPGPWSSPVWVDPATWSDDEVWGVGDMTVAEIKYIRRLFRKWKWAGAFPTALYLHFGGAMWGDFAAWDEAGHLTWLDTPADVAVIPLAHVWDFNAAIYGAPDDVWADEIWPDAFTFD